MVRALGVGWVEVRVWSALRVTATASRGDFFFFCCEYGGEVRGVGGGNEGGEEFGSWGGAVAIGEGA